MKYLLSVLTAASIATVAQADNIPAWAGSYSVGIDGNQCYCVMTSQREADLQSSGISVDVSGRSMPIHTVCNLISRILGDGGSGQRIYYNSLQCGHEPSLPGSAANGGNTNCPGILEGTNENCGAKGPKWSIGKLFTSNN